MTVAILYNPGHNRVYFKTAKELARQELTCCLRFLPIENIREETLGNLPYLLFDCENPPREEDLRQLARMSFTYGLFELETSAAGGFLLKPLDASPGYRFDESLSTILKYTGKTNELFTRMLINIAGTFGKLQEGAAILDPLCGKGTTLFEGLLQGYKVCGIESDEKILHEAYVFFKKYLERERVKHSSHIERVGTPRGRAKRCQISGASDSGGFAAEFVAGDTRDALKFFGKNKFDAAIGDLPYGVQHGSKSDKYSRNALPLLQEALPVWHKLLKPGGVLVLAWNLFLNTRAELEAALESAGFIVQQTGEFRHRVDQAIERDIMIGRKP